MKKRYSVLYLPPAERDLEAIFEYVRRDTPSQAGRFLEMVDRKIGRLALFPLSGSVPRDPTLQAKRYRILVLGNYLAFYKFERRQVTIYRVLHGRRRYEFLLT